MPEFTAYGKTKDFKSLVRNVQKSADYSNETPPVTQFTGTVKVDGTNAGIVFGDSATDFITQSRNKVISVGDDNYGFAVFVSGLPSPVMKILRKVGRPIFGEWNGQGIQRSITSKNFMIFSESTFTSTELEILNDRHIYHAEQFGNFAVVVDFARPELIEDLLDSMVKAVEKECPHAKKLGYSNVIGEGIVFKAGELKFKVKGDKHKEVKTKTPNPAYVEAYDNAKEFADYACTVSRMEKVLYLVEDGGYYPRERTGDFVKTVIADIVAEERDQIGGVDMKMVKHAVSRIASAFYKTKWG